MMMKRKCQYPTVLGKVSHQKPWIKFDFPPMNRKGAIRLTVTTNFFNTLGTLCTYRFEVYHKDLLFILNVFKNQPHPSLSPPPPHFHFRGLPWTKNSLTRFFGIQNGGLQLKPRVYFVFSPGYTYRVGGLVNPVSSKC